MDSPGRSILVVDDEPVIRTVISDTARLYGWQAIGAANAAEALEKIQTERPDAVITDLRMPGGMDGFQLFLSIRRLDRDMPVVIMSAFGNIETAVQSVKCGAFDYLPKPFRPERLGSILKSLEAARSLEEKAGKRPAPPSEVVGASKAMAAVQQSIEKAAGLDNTVFIQGEPGTGREFIARAIHRLSQRGESPFVAFRCSGSDPEVIERALFGSANEVNGLEQRHPGMVERAGQGTLFLDEILQIPSQVQGTLLSAIEEGSFLAVGGKSRIPLQCRLIVASAADLTQAVQNGQFRRDLFYRLHILPVHLPPLRNRLEDIPLLFEHFITKHALRGIERKTLSADAQALMVAYHWPGNVRELENCVERAAVMASGPEIRPEDLPEEVRRITPTDAANQPLIGCRLRDYEHAAVLNALRISHGNKRQAAKILEVSIATLYKKLRDYNIQV